MLSYLCVLLLAASALGQLDEATLDAQWEQWKITYKKEYNSLDEEGIRKAIWEKNMRMIEAHNQEAALGMHTYTLGMNHLGDMTSEEVVRRMTGLRVPKNHERKKGMMTSVRDQDQK